MGEAEPLDGVGELDVDAEVVGVELQGVARPEAGVLVHRQTEHRDAVADLEPPVPVARRIGPERRRHVGAVGHPAVRYQLPVRAAPLRCAYCGPVSTPVVLVVAWALLAALSSVVFLLATITLVRRCP